MKKVFGKTLEGASNGSGWVAMSDSKKWLDSVSSPSSRFALPDDENFCIIGRMYSRKRDSRKPAEAQAKRLGLTLEWI